MVQETANSKLSGNSTRERENVAQDLILSIGIWWDWKQKDGLAYQRHDVLEYRSKLLNYDERLQRCTSIFFYAQINCSQ